MNGQEKDRLESGLDQRVFGPYFGQPSKRRTAPKSPRQIRLAAKTKRLLRRHLELNRGTI